MLLRVGVMVFIAKCPLASCAWRSEPSEVEAQVHESRRLHISKHDHSALLEHVVLGLDHIERYEQVPA